MRQIYIKVKSGALVDNFINKAQSNFCQNVKLSQFTSGVVKKYIISPTECFIIYGFDVFGLSMIRTVGIFISAIMFIIGGLSMWLLFPLILVALPEIVSLLGLWLTKAGLRRAGYKDEIKHIKASEVIEEVLLNGAR